MKSFSDDVESDFYFSGGLFAGLLVTKLFGHYGQWWHVTAAIWLVFPLLVLIDLIKHVVILYYKQSKDMRAEWDCPDPDCNLTIVCETESGLSASKTCEEMVKEHRKAAHDERAEA